MGEQEIAFKALVRQRHMSYEAFCREWDRVAKSVDDVLKGHYPGRAQYYRWLRGELANKRPYPDACRMLEAMFPGWPVEGLFSPYTGENPQPADSLSLAEMPSTQEDQDNLTGIPSHTIDLSGQWWASWQTFRDRIEKIASPLYIHPSPISYCE